MPPLPTPPWLAALAQGDEQARRERFVAGICASHAEILDRQGKQPCPGSSAWLDEEGVTERVWPVARAAAGRESKSRPPAPGDLCDPAGKFASWKDDLFVRQAGITHCAGPSPIPGRSYCCPMAASRAPVPVPPAISPCWRLPP